MVGPRARLGRGTRLGLVAGALGVAAVLLVARRVEPDPRGLGTHTQLGLPPCQFLALTGRPCPSCGMTTAFAWVVRGRPDRAWRANPAGCLLAPLAAAVAAWSLASAAAGRSLGARSLGAPLGGVLVAIVAVVLVAWTVRLLSGRAL